jgi:hypothetical protein
LAVPQKSKNVGGDYGNYDFDIRHHFTFSTTYNIPGKKSWGQVLEGWQLNSIVHLQTGLPWSAIGSQDISQTRELSDRWDFFGNVRDFKPGPQDSLVGIPYFKGDATNMPSACTTAAASIGATASLNQFGCYAQGNSVLVAPPLGSFGTTPRNFFRADAFRNWDVSAFKTWKFRERFSAQFRAEFFNILNTPNFLRAPAAYGGHRSYGGAAMKRWCMLTVFVGVADRIAPAAARFRGRHTISLEKSLEKALD